MALHSSSQHTNELYYAFQVNWPLCPWTWYHLEGYCSLELLEFCHLWFFSVQCTMDVDPSVVDMLSHNATQMTWEIHSRVSMCFLDTGQDRIRASPLEMVSPLALFFSTVVGKNCKCIYDLSHLTDQAKASQTPLLRFCFQYYKDDIYVWFTSKQARTNLENIWVLITQLCIVCVVCILIIKVLVFLYDVWFFCMNLVISVIAHGEHIICLVLLSFVYTLHHYILHPC